MTISRLYCRAGIGVEAPTVLVETHLAPGLPAINVVGLAQTTVKESRDRVRSAIVNSSFDFPQRRITINLAPADLPKVGGRFDLPIAIGILEASQQLSPSTSDIELVGELALDGSLRAIPGILPVALACRLTGRQLICPLENADEASVSGVELLAANSLLAVCRHLSGAQKLQPYPATEPQPPQQDSLCLSQIRGQQQAKRALEIAAAGHHSALFCGPPGSGKSMLAQRLPGLLPRLSQPHALEVASVYSITQPRPLEQFYLPPFRSPHHTASAAALIGGGSTPRPGEASLAHHGVLFLDELPEFERRVLDVLREPMETGLVHISRAARQAHFPAAFQLIAAMNPCPCGYLGDPNKSCGYFCDRARRYQHKISGPLLDRIDLHIDVTAISADELLNQPSGEPSTDVRQRVLAARQRQLARQGRLNVFLDGHTLEQELGSLNHWLVSVVERLGLSARALHRSIRVARTLADLEGAKQVDKHHLKEALGFRGNG